MRLRLESRVSFAGSNQIILTVGLLTACGSGCLRAQEITAPARSVPQGTLALGQKASGELRPAALHEWTVVLKAGEYVEVEVHQAAVDVVVRVLAPSGQLRREFNASISVQGTERAKWLADATGPWTVVVTPAQKAAAGKYEVHFAVQRAPSEADRQLLLADSLHQAGADLSKRSRFAEAESLLVRARTIREKELGLEHTDVATSVSELGLVYSRRGDYRQAATLFSTALAVREKLLGPEHPDVARILENLATIAQRFGRNADAEQLFKRSLSAREKVLGSDHPEVAASLNGLAVLYMFQGRYSEAEPLYQRTLSIREKALGSEHADVGAVLLNLGLLYWSQGRLAEVEPLFLRCLAIMERALGSDDPAFANTLNSLASLYNYLGRRAEAEPLYSRVLAIRERVYGSDNTLVAGTVHNWANLKQNQGRHQEAESLYRRAVAIWEKRAGAGSPDLALGLRGLAKTLAAQGRYADAEPLYRRAQAIREQRYGPQDWQVASSLEDLASLYVEMRRYVDAEALYRNALAIYEKQIGPSQLALPGSLVNLAESMWLGDKNAAVQPLLDRAIASFDGTIGNPEGRIRAYALRARVRDHANDRNGALTDLAEAIRSVEELRPQVGGGEDTRALFFGRYADYFDLMVGWQLKAGAVERALEYAERSRARVLLDQLAAGKIDLRESIPSDVRAPLQARESRARARMAEYQQRLTLIRARTDLTADDRTRQSALLDDSLRIAERDFRAVYDEIKNASPLWRDLITSGGQSVSLATIQRTLVPARGFLMLYQIGGEQSFLFLIPSGSAAPYTVPLRIAPRDARVLGVQAGALTAATLDRVLAGAANGEGAAAADSVGLATLFGRAPTRGLGRSEQRISLERLHALWRVLVPDTVWRRLHAAPQVVIVPGRGLHTLPFEALVVTPGATAAQTRYWLDDGPAVRYAASASTLYNLERRATVRAMPSATQAAVLSLSNPIFDPGELAAPPAVPVQQGSANRESLTRNSFVSSGGSLSRLPGTAAETDAIRQAFGGANSSRVIALQGADATEANLRPALPGRRYLHVATHGLVDERRGALFAALALTPPTAATADNDGFLQLHEIYQLRLPELELAVLSACETNVGTTMGGEGVFALSRGFLAAGARRVIASQWAVEDRSTAELMGRFFRDIATAENSGRVVDFVVALRDSKRAVREKAGWAHPYYWAPFVLAGAR